MSSAMKSHSPILRFVVLALLLLCAGPASAAAADTSSPPLDAASATRFSTRGLPQAQGAVFSIEVPKDWEIRDSPRFVKKFVTGVGEGDDKALIEVFIAAQSIAGTADPKDLVREALTPKRQREMMPDGAKLLGSGEVKLQAVPAALAEFALATEDSRQHTFMLTFFTKQAMVQMQFVVGALPKSRAKVDRVFADHRALFRSMIDSIVVEDS
jgi:hypothetical protein